MTPEQEEAAGFAIYQQFIRHGIGTCLCTAVNGKQIQETPEQACVRRWRRLSQVVRDRFIAEGRAVIRTIEMNS